MSASPSSLGFTGEMTDDPTGLTYLRARYYHPSSGTLLTQDPVMGVVVGPASTFNPYLYVRGNPVNLTDPSGRIAPLLLAGAAALVGGLVGGLVGLAGDFIHQLQQNGGNLGCIDRGQMLREGLKGLIAGAAGGLAFAAAVTGAIGAAVTAIAGAAVSLATSVWGAITAVAGAVATQGGKLIENAYKLVSHAGKAVEELFEEGKRLLMPHGSSVSDVVETGKELGIHLSEQGPQRLLLNSDKSCSTCLDTHLEAIIISLDQYQWGSNSIASVSSIIR
ncbi:MAG: RHS repeat-associated core domain-containing protein [Chloroflexi bacterium]|nr:RHS repeat-associated core domain-containing protein [Chloroflexota bacterium]